MAVNLFLKAVLEIVAFKKIATTANFKPMTEGVELQVQFEEDGDKPILLLAWYIQQRNCKQQEKMGFYNGWGSAFDRLATFVTTYKKISSLSNVCCHVFNRI